MYNIDYRLKGVNPVRRFLRVRRLKWCIRKAYSQLLKFAPECNDVLFDESFLLLQTARLHKFLLGDVPLNGLELAIVWDKQFGRSAEKRIQRIQSIIPIATKFLALLVEESETQISGDALSGQPQSAVSN